MSAAIQTAAIQTETPPVVAPAEYVDRAIAILHWIEGDSDDARA